MIILIMLLFARLGIDEDKIPGARMKPKKNLQIDMVSSPRFSTNL
jgi:hypothetical protein